MTNTPDPAAARFALLQLVRLAGALLVLTGALVLSGKVEWLPRLPDAAGYAFVAAGLGVFFALPLVLARRWRSRP